MIRGYFLVTFADDGIKITMEDGNSGFFQDRLMLLDTMDQCSQYVRQLMREDQRKAVEEKIAENEGGKTEDVPSVDETVPE